MLGRILNDVKGLSKHFSMIQTQLEQVSRLQEDLFREMPKQHNKHAYGLGNPEGNPKIIGQYSQNFNASAPSSPKKKKNK